MSSVDRQLRIERRRLEADADARLEPVRAGRDVDAEDRRRARRPGSRSPSRISTVVVLPAPLGPSRPKTSPRADVEVDPVDGDQVAIALDQAADLDDRIARRRPRRARRRLHVSMVTETSEPDGRCEESSSPHPTIATEVHMRRRSRLAMVGAHRAPGPGLRPPGRHIGGIGQRQDPRLPRQPRHARRRHLGQRRPGAHERHATAPSAST